MPPNQKGKKAVDNGDSTASTKEKLKTKKNKSATTTGWSRTKKVVVASLIVGLVAVGISVVYPDIKDEVQERVCDWTGVWCEAYVDHQPQQPKSAKSSSKKTEKASSSSGNENENDDITSAEDAEIRKQLDKADKLCEQKRASEALTAYEKLLARYPNSPRALYGKAWALEVNSELQRSNTMLEQSIAAYETVLKLTNIPPALLIKAARKCASRMAFRGWSSKAAQTLEAVAYKHPEQVALWNEAGVQWLMTNQNEKARYNFQQALQRDPNSGFAKVHLGFILKVTDQNYAAAIPLLEEGIATREPGVIDGRFFFQLGDALYRAGQASRAYEVYQQGADEKLFKSMWQRSLYDIDRLTGRPWWTPKQTGVEHQLKILEQNYETIREEGMRNLDVKTGTFVPEEENLRDKGDWKQFTLWQQGRRNDAGCKRAPKTCALLEKFTEAKTCTRGQIKFSVIHPGTHVWPHCGPTNCRVRCHLGLVVPPTGPRIRVGNETRAWEEGKFIIFDDSFEHEVWHDGTELRLVLIVDIWHPEITASERASLSPI